MFICEDGDVAAINRQRILLRSKKKKKEVCLHRKFTFGLYNFNLTLIR